jgi:hypothetical protein
MTSSQARENRLREINLRWLELARSGDLERAWAASDEASALQNEMDCSQWPRHRQFIWRGESLRDKRVLIRCYHGLGDTIQFARFIPHVRAVAREVVLWAQPILIPILASLRDGAHRILPLHEGAPDVEYDVELELFELMHALRLTLRDVRVEVPYLLWDEPARGVPGSQRQVGLVWRAGDWNEDRSIPPRLLAPLGALDGIRWHLFQRGPGLSSWCNGFGEIPTLTDIVSEARQMRRLDLLISVDTCSAHLAGASGVPVWTLLPHSADWRWMRDRSDTPWYPSMKLFRQRSAGDWSGVVGHVIAELNGTRYAAD